MRKVLLALIGIVLLGSSGAVLLVSRTIPTDEPGTPTSPKLVCIMDGTPLDLVGCIRNEDVHWSGTYFGLMPNLSEAAIKLVKAKENIESMLLDALLDEDKFVVAHVLLTYRSHSHFTGGTTAWNGLRVHLVADQPISYEGNDLAKLHEYWEKKLQP